MARYYIAKHHRRIVQWVTNNRTFILAVLVFLALAMSLLLGDIPPEASDLVSAQTYRDLLSSDIGNRSRPIERIVVFGDAGAEVDDRWRSKLCGGNLWMDHLAEALGADLYSYAHGYSIVNTKVEYAKGERVVRKKSRMSGDNGMDVSMQVARILNNYAKHTADGRALYVLVVDPSNSANGTIEALSSGANKLILSPQIRARRLLVVDAPSPAPTSRHMSNGGSLSLASVLINDPSVELLVYDSNGFLTRMQREHYKYGLRFPDHPCIYNEIKRCNKPDRFFWCDASRVGSKAHFFLADDIIKKHFMDSLLMS
ncbi:hypothetical protein GQ54DRAFT_320500 [Martensiomyces pterosporus]|nr:hypothetical protein GQ54DRAFT_320500 [Martensiomyces pterosporus]